MLERLLGGALIAAGLAVNATTAAAGTINFTTDLIVGPYNTYVDELIFGNGEVTVNATGVSIGNASGPEGGKILEQLKIAAWQGPPVWGTGQGGLAVCSSVYSSGACNTSNDSHQIDGDGSNGGADVEAVKLDFGDTTVKLTQLILTYFHGSDNVELVVYLNDLTVVSMLSDYDPTGCLDNGYTCVADLISDLSIELVGSVFSVGADYRKNKFKLKGVGYTVVPIPAALPLFGTAIAGMGFIGWRRKRLAAAA